MYILPNKYFCCTVFKKTDLNWIIILTGCREYLYISVYMIWGYETLLLKWNGETLMKWLSEQFWRCCLCVYVLIETSRFTKGKCCLCHPFIQRYDCVIMLIRSCKSVGNEQKWWFCVKKHQVNMYYQRMWSDHSESRSVKEISQHSGSTADRYTYTNVTQTFLVDALFQRTLLFQGAWAVTEQNDREECHTAQWWRLRESNQNTAGWCGAAYIFGCRKFSASLVNGQNGIVSALDYILV